MQERFKMLFSLYVSCERLLSVFPLKFEWNKNIFRIHIDIFSGGVEIKVGFIPEYLIEGTNHHARKWFWNMFENVCIWDRGYFEIYFLSVNRRAYKFHFLQDISLLNLFNILYFTAQSLSYSLNHGFELGTNIH